MRFAILRLLTCVRSLLGDRRGVVGIIFAFAATAMVIAVGMGIDMWRAYSVKARLQSAVDAAALAIASTNQQNFTQAQLQGRVQSFVTANYPAAALGTPSTPTLSYGANINTINIGDSATVPTTFMWIIGVRTLTVSATSQAKAAYPNIDFYLLLDDSPSMAIAATQAGINTMVAKTSAQGGCAFACHEVNPSADSLGNPGGASQDNYALAQSLGVTLRIDMLRQATQNLMTTAQQTENGNDATYRMAVYTFDVNFNTIQTLTPNLTQAQTSSGNISMLEVYKNNWLTQTNNNSDEDTNYDNAMTNINTTMPNPGNGTNAPGDTPKEVMFFVTDGVEDENVNGGRQISVLNTSWCTTIKNRGILIAVLYPTYLPLPTNAFYNSNVAPFQSNIGPTLESCASPGLYFNVTSDADISAALATLFQQAVNAVFLSK